MVRVRKSPNMMSTTGRRPVMAAPTPTPVNPASEMGVSTTRSAPNSSTRPERTLKGVPASATSSPKMQTRLSRRISSASASRTACANVSSRSGIDVLFHLIDAGIRRRDSELHRGCHLGAGFGGDLFERGGIGVSLRQQPVGVQFDGVAVRLPVLLFLLRAIVFAIDVADVMAAVAVGVGLQEGGTSAATGALHEATRDIVDGAYILAVDLRGFESEGRGATKDCSGGGLAEVCVLVIHIVFADVDHRQFPELRKVHDFVERALAEGAFAEETDCDASVAEALRGKRRAGRDAYAAADDCICAKIAGGWIGDVHRSAFTAAVAGFLAEEFGEHAVGGRALRQAVPVAAMRAGDVVVDVQRFADADRDGFLSAIKMSKSRHQRARVEFVHLLFEVTDAHHLAVGAQPLVFS